MKQTTSLSAALSPAKHAAPKPRRGSVTTTAPWAAATCAEASVEPLSTTMGRHPAGKRPRTWGRASSSSSTGSTTSITGPTLEEGS
jgi:hypothetical protein